MSKEKVLTMGEEIDQLKRENTVLQDNLKELGGAIAKIGTAFGIIDGSFSMTGPQLLSLAEDVIKQAPYRGVLDSDFD